jgi:predicted nucleotidyltransferase
MTLLPEKIRRTLEKIVSELRVRENVYGVGLFGSWSRADATPSSDVDLFILDRADFPYEYVERMEINGLRIDLDHVPKRWIHGPIPPEIDQKLFEMQILYDRDWSLTNTRLLMNKCYGSAERVDIRTDAHVIDCDVHLSRATSAFSREDFHSAFLFATVALEDILRVLMEVALEPFSNSHLVERLGASAAKLERRDYFNEYLKVARLDKSSYAEAAEKLKLFKEIWDEVKAATEQNSESLSLSHFKVKTKLNYYMNKAFLQGMLARASSMMDSSNVVEASHYLKNVLLDIVENYAWLRSLVDGVRIDYTTLMSSLKTLEEKSPENYDSVVKSLDLDCVDKHAAASVIKKTREMVLELRRERKPLIKKYL